MAPMGTTSPPARLGSDSRPPLMRHTDDLIGRDPAKWGEDDALETRAERRARLAYEAERKPGELIWDDLKPRHRWRLIEHEEQLMDAHRPPDEA
jgi:hypothetical protein